ncbi:hypothetical protein ABZ313_42660 [Streptomyces sp. NPDC006251]|uniref:hypothetical protein n=1 Tax=Streptomyces sp. NPDC006251 TaxID=3155718 RepID=UPI0033B3203C
MRRNKSAGRASGRRFTWADPTRFGSSGDTMGRAAASVREAANQGEDFRVGRAEPRRRWLGRRGGS